MSYFLPFFTDSGSTFFLGRPFPGTLRIASRALSGYMASFTKGSIPAVCRRLWAVLYVIPRASAISCIVNPFTVIHSLSALFYHILSKVSTYYYTLVKQNSRKNEKLWIFSKFTIDINVEMFDNKNIRQLNSLKYLIRRLEK